MEKRKGGRCAPNVPSVNARSCVSCETAAVWWNGSQVCLIREALVSADPGNTKGYRELQVLFDELFGNPVHVYRGCAHARGRTPARAGPPAHPAQAQAQARQLRERGHERDSSGARIEQQGGRPGGRAGLDCAARDAPHD